MDIPNYALLGWRLHRETKRAKYRGLLMNYRVSSMRFLTSLLLHFHGLFQFKRAARPRMYNGTRVFFQVKSGSPLCSLVEFGNPDKIWKNYRVPVYIFSVNFLIIFISYETIFPVRSFITETQIQPCKQVLEAPSFESPLNDRVCNHRPLRIVQAFHIFHRLLCIYTFLLF